LGRAAVALAVLDAVGASGFFTEALSLDASFAGAPQCGQKLTGSNNLPPQRAHVVKKTGRRAACASIVKMFPRKNVAAPFDANDTAIADR
jgi:hypothetical protein